MMRIVPPRMKRASMPAALLLTTLLFASHASAQGPTSAERVAALKQTLQADQARLREYQWIETTVVSIDGEENSRSMNECYYDVEGKLQKVPVSSPPAEEGGRGLRGRIVEGKKEEMADYMKQAVDLVQSYVPPDPAQIQAAMDAGKFSVNMVEPGKRVRLEFRDYHLVGDVLAVEIDLTTNRILGLGVSTYLENPEDTVTLEVSFASLPDGTGYPAQIALEAKAKDLTVTVENSGYRKMAGS